MGTFIYLANFRLQITWFSAVATVVLNSSAANATPAAQLFCPPSMEIAVATTQTNLPQWQADVKSALYLNSATPIDGPPAMHGDLADYTTRPGKKEWSYTYNLERNFSNGLWLECGYGTHNEATLAQRMPASIKACTFTYRHGSKAGQHDIKIDCH